MASFNLLPHPMNPNPPKTPLGLKEGVGGAVVFLLALAAYFIWGPAAARPVATVAPTPTTASNTPSPATLVVAPAKTTAVDAVAEPPVPVRVRATAPVSVFAPDSAPKSAPAPTPPPPIQAAVVPPSTPGPPVESPVLTTAQQAVLQGRFATFVPQFAAATGIKLVPIPAGRFTMGDTTQPTQAFTMGGNGNGPPHEVTISRPFFLGTTDVTQAQWTAVMGANPSHFKGELLPVESVTWEEAMAFCQKLTERERAAGRLPDGYVLSLPTEAQWEYACRAGTTGLFAGDHDATAWWGKNSGGTTHPVGIKQPNGWGLYDMNGNVWQWCLDWAVFRYPSGNETDPTGPPSGTLHINRGGGYQDGAGSATRGVGPSRSGPDIGFRLALVPTGLGVRDRAWRWGIGAVVVAAALGLGRWLWRRRQIPSPAALALPSRDSEKREDLIWALRGATLGAAVPLGVRLLPLDLAVPAFLALAKLHLVVPVVGLVLTYPKRATRWERALLYAAGGYTFGGLVFADGFAVFDAESPRLIPLTVMALAVAGAMLLGAGVRPANVPPELPDAGPIRPATPPKFSDASRKTLGVILGLAYLLAGLWLTFAYRGAFFGSDSSELVMAQIFAALWLARKPGVRRSFALGLLLLIGVLLLLIGLCFALVVGRL